MSSSDLPPPTVASALKALICELEQREASLLRQIEDDLADGRERVDLEHRVAWTRLHIRSLQTRRPAR